MTNLYSQFLEYGGRGHVTWEFKPGKCSLPCNEGDDVKIIVIGKYNDSDISADIVKIILPNKEELTHQKDGQKLLHITRETRNGVKAVQSGIRATKYGYEKIIPYEIRAKASYFTGR